MNACYNCGSLNCTEENFCFGCKVYICEDCDLNPTLMGYHIPEAHGDLDVADEYEEEDFSDLDD